ncbi:MAG: DUF4234 domain-containing protein [Conexivisphaerales archaeon]
MASTSLELLRKDIDLKVITDKNVSTLWILLPFLSIIVALIFFAISIAFFSPVAAAPTFPFTFFTLGFGPFFAVFFLIDILQLYFFYILIRRRNQHFARQHNLTIDIIAVLKDIAARKSINIDGVLGSIENIKRTEQVEETEKSAVLWVILLLIPIVGIIAWLYIFYFLNYDFYNHEKREDFLLSDLERAFTALGLQFSFRRSSPIQHRSYVLYLVLTIITFGLFGIYWEYTFITDGNNHFANHSVFEQSILQLVAAAV